jgi:hypothetical protein
MKKFINPVVKRVIDNFDMVYTMTQNFIINSDPNSEKGQSALKGLCIPGDAGLGKTHYVKKAIVDLNGEKNVEYIKGGSITAAALFVKLYLNKDKGRIVILDDVDIVHRSGKDRSDMIDMIKGATEPALERYISWETAQSNPLMKQHGVPNKFKFDGTIIWITNDTMASIEKATKNHWAALASRFTWIPCFFNDDEKILYTLHCITEYNMLGEKCQAKKGGYPDDVVDDVVEYLQNNYDRLQEITPRMAVKIADLRHFNPDNWKTLVRIQCFSH